MNGLWEEFLARLSYEDILLVYGDEGAEKVREVQEHIREIQNRVAWDAEHRELDQ